MRPATAIPVSRGYLAFVLAAGVATLADGQQLPTVTGRVVADDTGAPLRNAWVTSGREEARTDTEGRFRLTLPAARAVVRVTKPGYVPDVRESRAGAQANVRLTRGGAITIHVMDPSGEPKQARVTVTTARGPGSPSATLQSATDDRGELRIGNLPAGRYRVGIGGEAFRIPGPLESLTDEQIARLREEMRRGATQARRDVSQTGQLVDLGAGQEEPVYLVDGASPAADSMTPRVFTDTPVRAGTVSVRGRIAARDGRPIPGAIVTFSGRDVAGRALADASGQYTLENLPAGRIGISASKSGFVRAPGSSRIVSATDGQSATGIDLTLARATDISGTVVDEYGEPVERAAVMAVRLEPDEKGAMRMGRSAAGATDDRGRFRIAAAPGSYYLLTQGEIGHPGQSQLFFPGVLAVADAKPVRVGDDESVSGIEFRLNPALGARLAGKVIDSMGNPMSGRTVQLTGNDSSAAPAAPRAAVTRTDGSFEFRNVAFGDYVLEVRTAPSVPTLRGVSGSSVRAPQASESGLAAVSVAIVDPGPVIIRTAP